MISRSKGIFFLIKGRAPAVRPKLSSLCVARFF